MDTTEALTGIAYGSIAYGVATAVAPRAVVTAFAAVAIRALSQR